MTAERKLAALTTKARWLTCSRKRTHYKGEKTERVTYMYNQNRTFDHTNLINILDRKTSRISSHILNETDWNTIRKELYLVNIKPVCPFHRV